MHTHHGSLILHNGRWRNALELAFWRDDAWQALALSGQDDAFTAESAGVRVELGLEPDEDSIRYRLSFSADSPTRVQLKLSVAEASNPFHLIPGCIFGDNNVAKAEPGHFPNLTFEHPGNVSCSPYWELRADRASHPVSALLFDGGLAAVSVDPYSDAGFDIATSREGFLRNGVFSELGDEETPSACGVTLGYRNTPVSFINKDQWGIPTGHRAVKASATGRIFLRPAASRQDMHAVIQQVYDDYHEAPSAPLSAEEAARALMNAFLTINWLPEKEHFSNMRCIDAYKRHLTAWRTLPEVGWTGGGVIGYPLLLAGQRFDDATAVERAMYLFEWVAKAHNPESGLLWDVCGKHEGRRVDWWWSGYLVRGVHCAYTNGSGVYYLLKAYTHEKATSGADHREWLDTACKVLDTMVGLQTEEGNFGYTYDTRRPAIIDPEGFAGVWFAPAMALAYRHTQNQRYLDSAKRGMDYYRRFVRDLNCCGSPMDTWKSPEQEGNLGFIRGAQVLHAITGDDVYLEMLEEGACYEYLWRYGFRARPEYPPLEGSHWNSCGGSITSVSNPHIHPMGVYISSELRYLAEHTAKAYHAARWEDNLHWGINIVSLYPEVSGYGAPGVLTERFCPSDGLTIETFPDGSPSSLWFSYNGWAAAAVLEALVEHLL